MAKKYMLISVIKREIMTEQFDTLQEAQGTMYYEMQQAGIPVIVLSEDEYDNGDYGFGEDCGYITGGLYGSNYDWRIVEL